MRGFAAGLLLVLALQPLSASVGPSPDELAIANAIELLKVKKPAEALDALGPTLASLETQVAAASEKGVAFCATDMTEAILYAGMAASAKKDGTVLSGAVCEAMYYKAFALVELGKKDEAISTLERLTSLAPMHAQYFVELGFAYRASGLLDKAEAAYQQAKSASEMAGDKGAGKLSRAAALRGIGYILIEKGDLKGAEKAYRDSLKDDPDSQVAKSELDFIKSKQPK